MGRPIAFPGVIQVVPNGGGVLASNVFNAFNYAGSTGTYTIPNLTGQTGFGLANLSKSSGSPTSLVTSDGWTIDTGFATNTLSILAPTSMLTAHGTWGNVQMEPPLVSDIASGNTLVASVLLTSSLAVLIVGTEGNIAYAVAVNTTTGAIGTPISLGINVTDIDYTYIYRVSDTSFVANVQSTAARQTITVGTVSSLAITLGTGVNTTDDYFDCVQLSDTLLFGLRADGSVEAIEISGTTVTIGTAVSVGSVSASEGSIRIERLTATSAVIAYLITGGGAAARDVSGRVATISGTTVTLETAAVRGSNTGQNNSIWIFQPFGDGASFLVVNELGALNTTGEYTALSVSGTTVTFGTKTDRLLDVPNAITNYRRKTFITENGKEVLTSSTNQIVLSHTTPDIYAVICSGTTLTFGANFTTGSNPTLSKNFAKDAIYAEAAASTYKLAYSGATISSALTIASGHNLLISDTLSDQYVAYSGEYYSWNITNCVDAVSPGFWVRDTGSTIVISGEIT